MGLLTGMKMSVLWTLQLRKLLRKQVAAGGCPCCVSGR